MVVGFGAFCFYDAYIRYPQQNLDDAKKELPAELQDTASINDRVTEATVKTLKKGISLEEISKEIGPPAWRGEFGEHNDRAVWFGRGGSLVVLFDRMGVIRTIDWKVGKYGETDLWLQLAMGLVLAPLALIMLFRLIAMCTRGAEFSDQGLKPSGKELIPFDSMTGWDTESYKDRGQITLKYDSASGNSEYVLDDYKLAAFKTIVNEISQRKGFDNPIKEEASPTEVS